MARIAATFIIVCIIAIAASAGLVLYLRFGFDIGSATSVAMSVLAVLVIIHFQSIRMRDRGFVVRQVNPVIDRVNATSEDLAAIENRLSKLEEGLPSRTLEELEPVFAEIEVLGTLVKQLAETLAEMEIRIDGLAANKYMAPADQEFTDEVAHATRLETVDQDDATDPGEIVDSHRMRDAVRKSVEGNRVDLFLQPIVTLPQRKTRYYEALTRLRSESGELMLPADYISVAEQSGVMPAIDNILLFRSVQIVRRMSSRNREIGVFCNISPASLVDTQFFTNFIDFMEKNRELNDRLIFEFSQETIRNLGPVEIESLAALREIGFGFSVDRVSDLKINYDELADLGIQFIKVPAALMLGDAAAVGGEIHTADLAKFLTRYGVELIVDHIETEAQVVDILDFDVQFGQGFLFSPPRPVRAEVVNAQSDDTLDQTEALAG